MNMNRICFLLALLSALSLAACVTPGGGPTLDVEPLTNNFDNMPVEAATIISAVAVQGATQPLERSGKVTFAKEAMGLSEPRLGLEGFDYTGATLYFHSPINGSSPGVTSAEIEYTDPFERKATILFRAEYVRDGNGYLINKLDMKKTYTETPRVQVTVVLASDLPDKPMQSYQQLVSFLAAYGLPPDAFKTSSLMTYAIIAVGQDWAGPGSELSVAVSASKIGLGGFKKNSKSYLVDGWPVAIAVGDLNPSDTENELYAKVGFKKGGGGFLSATRLLGVYQLAAFDK